MSFSFSSPNKVLRIATVVSLTFMIFWGLTLVLVQVKPFWVDEWRIIYNLKYKDAAALWGPLDFMQQFPRVYLEFIKAFTSVFDYSYFSLRLPSFVVGTSAILLAYKLTGSIFKQQQLSRFLFVLIIIASPAFFDYYVQIKQYTMDILLSLAAIWQLLQLLDLVKGISISKRRYFLVCLSFLVVPFFSYTYPIVIAPVFIIMFLHSVKLVRQKEYREGWIKLLFKLWLPLIIAATSIMVFYLVDASQLMKDNRMHFYWGYLMMQGGFSPVFFCKGFYNLFALAGSGFLFEIIFGVLGITAFIITLIKSARSLNKKSWDTEDAVNWYCTGLIVLVLLLFSLGKVPIGERRLNSYCLPVIAILIISIVNRLQQIHLYRKLATGIPAILFIGVFGSIVTSPVNELLDAQHGKKLSIYVNTENAIILAGIKKIPIFITPGIAYPHEKIINFPCTNIAATALCIPPKYINMGCANLADNMPGDWILKTFPAYKLSEHTLVYALNDLSELEHCMLQLPPDIKSVMAGDGNTFREIIR